MDHHQTPVRHHLNRLLRLILNLKRIWLLDQTTFAVTSPRLPSLVRRGHHRMPVAQVPMDTLTQVARNQTSLQGHPWQVCRQVMLLDQGLLTLRDLSLRLDRHHTPPLPMIWLLKARSMILQVA